MCVPVSRRVRVVVGNDDGPGAAGLRVLYTQLCRAGHAPVLRPSTSRTPGTGTGDLSGNGEITCATAMWREIRAGGHDVALTGVNHGPNVWPLAIQSGTVGGALTAMSLGVSAIAISMDDEYSRPAAADLSWEASEVVCRAVGAVLEELASLRYLLSINVPGIRREKMSGVAIAKRTAGRGGVTSEMEILRSGQVSIMPLGSVHLGDPYESAHAAQVVKKSVTDHVG
jgi:broad specificity polyphosphatase/5'/3'-nucleotidase SurE